MAKVQFRAKIETVYNMDDTVAYRRVKVPKLKQSHCDMSAMRMHSNSRISGFSNPDLFPNILAGYRREIFGQNIDTFEGYVRLDKMPERVTVVEKGLFATVSFDI